MQRKLFRLQLITIMTTESRKIQYPIQFSILSFYKFVDIKHHIQFLKLKLTRFCVMKSIRGTIIIANEGINVNVCSSKESLNKFCDYVKSFHFFNDIKFKVTTTTIQPFKKLKVKLKKEIISFDIVNLDLKKRGIYLNSSEWDIIAKDKNTIVIDTRNYYEHVIGSFKNSVKPHIHHFSEMAQWLKGYLQKKDKQVNIAMFCTGGIRCEKATAYVVELGFTKVYQLKDGIIKYLEDNKDKSDSCWQGNCFVFDDRITY